MKMLERILVPTDFSETAEGALKVATAIAQVYGSEMHLLHVVCDIEMSPADLGDVYVTTEDRLRKTANELEGKGIRVAKPAVESGSPFHKIIEYADHHDVNVIVMGARGSDEGDHVIGFTAEKAVRRATKPVWIVGKDSAELPAQIVCAVDFSKPSSRAMDNAVHLARNLKAELTVVHVIQPPFSLHGSSGRVACEYEAEQEEQLDRFLQPYDFSKVTWKKAIRIGKASEEIIKLATEVGADLLVMGSVGRTGLARMMVGSTAEKVVRGMPCSAITVKSEDVIKLELQDAIENVESSFREGRQLLSEGYPREAMNRFKHCVEQDMMFAPAYEGMAEAHEHMGHSSEANAWLEQASFVHKKNWERKVEAEIRTEVWGKKTTKKVDLGR